MAPTHAATGPEDMQALTIGSRALHRRCRQPPLALVMLLALLAHPCISALGSPDAPADARAAAAPQGWRHLPRQCMPWLGPIDNRRAVACGSGYATPCNVTRLQQLCDATPGCNAFNTNGFLKVCPGGRCGCDASAAACIRGNDIYSTDPALSYGCDYTDM